MKEHLDISFPTAHLETDLPVKPSTSFIFSYYQNPRPHLTMGVFSKLTKTNTSSLLALLASAASVAAHGHVESIIINGVYYQNYDPTSFPYQENPPVTPGWTIEQLDNGFVAPSAFADPDIICHRDAEPAQGHVEVAAGDIITIQWTEWPESHHGPVIDYLANCNGACESVDKTTLEFFKIDGLGLIEQGSPGKYAADALIENGNTWNVKIPENIAAGNYVLRHEIIALHSAGQSDGAQSYPQCFNLKVTGSGTETPAGYLGTELYDASDAGILVNIYTDSLDYEVPGPTLIDGGVSSIAQGPSAATATATATPAS